MKHQKSVSSHQSSGIKTTYYICSPWGNEVNICIVLYVSLNNGP